MQSPDVLQCLYVSSITLFLNKIIVISRDLATGSPIKTKIIDKMIVKYSKFNQNIQKFVINDH